MNGILVCFWGFGTVVNAERLRGIGGSFGNIGISGGLFFRCGTCYL